MTIRGSCLCGQVRYEIPGGFDSASHCHCSQCRKAHGAAFASYGVLPAAAFSIVAGDDAIASYRPSAASVRTFCRHCGSNLEWRGTGTPTRTAVALGTLDEDPGIRPGRHIHVASGATWHRITDDLPQFPADAAHDSA